MTNFDILHEINRKMAEHIEAVENNEKGVEISSVFSFVNDLKTWVSYCGDFKDNLLAIEAQDECIKSVILCVQGFYKEAMIAMRQCLEHMLFAIMLSTNDYEYRLWKRGKRDVCWSNIVDVQNGIFSKEFIRTYAEDIDETRSDGLLDVARDAYRECSEYVHGNFEKLEDSTEKIEYNEQMFDKYMEVFGSVRYILSASMIIRFREVLNQSDVLIGLEEILMENLGFWHEIQAIYCD